MKDLFDIRRYRADGKRFRISSHDPAHLPKGITRADAEHRLAEETTRLRTLQEKLYAERRWCLLVILQGMDAAGKDGIIEHVFSGVNPQGCEVHSFKAPSEEELDHDFLWRTTRRLPPRGDIGIFNRSYYEEVLVVRVFSALLDRQRLPSRLVNKHIWRERFDDIVAHERYLSRNGIAIRKIFLNVSQEEQQQRLLKRIEDPVKQWKFASADLDQRQHWPAFMRAYEDAIRHTTTPVAPWYVVPADRKWWARTIVSRIIADALDDLNPRVPEVRPEQRRQMAAVKRALLKRST